MANSVFKVENGIDIKNNANIAGNLTVGGNLNVSGNLVSSGTSAGDLIPLDSTYKLGNTTNRWSLNANVVNVQGDTTVNGFSVSGNSIFSANIAPNANNVALGNTSRRWDAYSNNLNSLTINVSSNSTLGNLTSTNTTISGLFVVNPGAGNTLIVSGNSTFKNLALSSDAATVGGNVNFDSGVLFVDSVNNRVGVNNTSPDAAFTITGTANVSANARFGGWIRVGNQDVINSSGNWVGSAAGFQGVQGAQGVQGTVGAQGSAGAQGTVGAQGTIGAQGAQGVQGTTGAQGTAGAQGFQGFQGNLGAGTQGSQGVQGAQGVTGSPTGTNANCNSWGVGTAASGTTGEIRATNNITAYYSDDRLKQKLGNLEHSLEKLMSLSGFYYQANEVAQSLGYKPKKEIGLSAQQVQKHFPELVTEAPIDSKYLTLYYERLIPVIVEAIKELNNKIDKR